MCVNLLFISSVMSKQDLFATSACPNQDFPNLVDFSLEV
jgi:hypothetical protein